MSPPPGPDGADARSPDARGRSRWRRLGANLAVLLGTLLVFSLLLEGIVRVTGLAFEPQFDLRGQRVFVRSPDPGIREELQAGFDGTVLGARVRTNSYGLRGDDVPLEKAPGTFRIAVLGDSWAFGWGVGQGDELPAALQKLLREEATTGEPRYEVLNFAVPAYNTLQELEVLRTKALRFQPDLVLIAYNINDVEGLDPDRPDESLESVSRWLERKLVRYSHLIRLVDNRLRRLALQMDLERSGKIDYYHRLYASDSDAWRRVQAALQEIRDEAHGIGARVYLVECPWMNVLDETNPYRDLHHQVMAAAARMEIPAFDLFASFEGKDATKLRISPLDGHPTAEGHRIAARAVADDLRRQGLIPSSRSD